jgi:hypothetical protein
VCYILSMCIYGLSYPARNAHAPILSPVANLALPFFSTLAHEQHDIRENVAEHKVCVLTFSTIFF